MKKSFIYNLSVAGIVVFLVTASSCVKDLDQIPYDSVTSATIYKDPANYKSILAKMYAGLAVSGQQGPSGKPDISGIDEGFSQYLRQYWKVQELTTDEAVIGWNDGSLPTYHNMTWTSSNEFNAAMYNRLYYQISLCNEFIRQTSDEKMAARGITVPDLKAFRAETRFLRALSYWHGIDLYGSIPFVVETDGIGAFLPRQGSRSEIFNYIESELKAIEGDLYAGKSGEYGRANQATAWMLLSKLYLNADVYTGTKKYTEALTYINKVIGAGYDLEPKYANMFLTDNDKSREMIFPVESDGIHTKTYGAMTFLVHAPVGGAMVAADFGINGGWSGLRTTKNFVQLFTDTSDTRAMLFKTGQSLEIGDIFTFTDGYARAKFKNVSSTGVKGSDPSGDFPDTDFPMFRLADAYLMYAECVLRGGTGGDITTALTYINRIRTRAYNGSSAGNKLVGELTLEFILAERSRELSWEGHRRTDLIRFGKYTTGYTWPWKGGIAAGKDVDTYRNLMPIPATDMSANPNLVQNPGY
jgi:starch-binding outer membrane protein, SusD/RagB family